MIVSINYRKQISNLILNRSAQPRLIIYDAISDDAFYYLKIAEHILNDSTSTFDGFTLTNGYHPLWMLILVGMGVFLNVHTIGYAILMLGIVVLILLAGTFYFHRLRRELIGEDSNYTASILYFYSALFISKNGLEVCLLFLLIPLFFLQLIKTEKKTDNRTYFFLGLIISILVLSRLDAVLFVLLTLALFVLVKWRQHSILPSLKNMVSLFLGVSPFIAYLIYNVIVFGHATPISGRAKSLRLDGFVLSQKGLNSLHVALTHDYNLFLFSLVTLAALLVTIFYFVRRTSFKDMVFSTTMIYPVFFFAYYLLTSDWQFWSWYYYPLAISFSFGYVFFEGLVIYKNSPLARVYEYSVIAITITVTIILGAWIGLKYPTRPSFIPDPILEAAVQIQGFSSDHPGVYAMGDRAGVVSFLMTNPVVQLEGLVAGNEMLDSIKAGRNLVDVLQKYSVNYYIATNPENIDGCWRVHEPNLPGENAPRMTAVLCRPPIFTFKTKRGDVTTMIFEVGRSSR